MSMCYLCDLCYHKRYLSSKFYCSELPSRVRPMRIDYGRDDPKEICKHFELKGGGDDQRE